MDELHMDSESAGRLGVVDGGLFSQKFRQESSTHLGVGRVAPTKDLLHQIKILG
jgi:hypothetical protein